MSKVDVLLARLTREEGDRIFPYDDATGARVRAPSPQGHISWGRGFNLDECGGPGLFDVMERYLVEQHDHVLAAYAWYNALDDIRGSVPLDIAYNAGDAGELLHFPHMIAAFAKGDITVAANECRVADPKLDASRYAPLRKILLTGTT